MIMILNKASNDKESLILDKRIMEKVVRGSLLHVMIQFQSVYLLPFLGDRLVFSV